MAFVLDFDITLDDAEALKVAAYTHLSSFSYLPESDRVAAAYTSAVSDGSLYKTIEENLQKQAASLPSLYFGVNEDPPAASGGPLEENLQKQAASFHSVYHTAAGEPIAACGSTTASASFTAATQPPPAANAPSPFDTRGLRPSNTSESPVSVFAKKYKPVHLKSRPVLTELPAHFRIVRNIIGDPLEDMPPVPTHPTPFVPTGRYTAERAAIIEKNHEGHGLWPDEMLLIHNVLMAQEAAFAWNESEKGRFREDFFPPVEFPTIPHTPWVEKNIPIPPGIYKQVCKIVRDKIESGSFERSNSSYRGKWFCVVKKDGTSLRLVHSLEPLNRVTIRHSGVPPIPDHMAEQFAGRACGASLDLYVGYDERTIAENSRDFTTFQTPYGALRLTTLPMGWTNSVPIFHDDVTAILQDEIPHVALVYIDDVNVRGPPTPYLLEDGSYETIPDNPRIRRYVFEHLTDVNRVIQRIKYSGGTFSGPKGYLCVLDYMVVGNRCTPEGRKVELTRIDKVLSWRACRDVSDVKAFLGTVGVARNFIRDFAKTAHWLTHLTRKDIPWSWDGRHDEAMDKLKVAVATSPALRPIDYESDAPVWLAVDTSYIAVGFILGQFADVDRKVKYFNRFGSITLNDRERRFSQPKLELYGLYRVLRASKLFLIGVRNLVVEVDARYIKGMLNNPDIAPSASINRWIVSILLFQFELVHVPGERHGPDGLSRRHHQDGDRQEEPEDDEEFDDWVDNLYGFMHILNEPAWELYDAARDGSVFALCEVPMFALRELKEAAAVRDIAKDPVASYDAFPRSSKAQRADRRLVWTRDFLDSPFARPADMSESEFARNVRYAANFFFVKGKLWRRDYRGEHQVVIPPERRIETIKGSHDYLGHKGVFGTQRNITYRCWWPGVQDDVRWWVRSCHACQVRQLRHTRIPPIVPPPATLWVRVHVDTAHMPPSGGYKYLSQARCSLSGYPEYEMSRTCTGEVIAAWFRRDLLYRWGTVAEIITDNGGPYVKAVEILHKEYNIRGIRISGYNSQANGLIEKPHWDVRQSLVKAADGDQSKWSQVAGEVFWAERIIPKRRLGVSPYFIVTGTHPLLPTDLMEATYLVEPPTATMTREDLLAFRAKQLMKRESDIERMRSRVFRQRRKYMEKFVEKHAATIHDFNFAKGDLVLVRNTRIEKELNRKMKPRYLGPLVVLARNRGGAYVLCELDGTMYHRPFAAFRLLPYVARRSIPLPPIATFVDTPSRLEQMALDDDTADEDTDGVGVIVAAGEPGAGDVSDEDDEN